MKKFKKIIISALIAVSALGLAFGLTACEEEHVHTFDEWTDIVNTCSDHVQSRKCSVCGHGETKVLEADGHVFGEWEDLVNTCTEHVQSRKCSVCGHEETKTLEPVGHDYVEKDIVNTCKERFVERRCTRCGHSVSMIAAPEGHKWSDWTVFVDNCDEQILWRVCSKCQRREYEQTLKAGHEYENWQDVVNTCAEHIQVGFCKNCGVQSLRELEAKGHVKVGNICIDCGMEYVDGKPLDYTDRYNSTYGYDYFKANNMLAQRALYLRIDEAVRRFHLDTSLNATHYAESTYYIDKIRFTDLNLTTEEAVAVWKTYKDDNPLYYWLSSGVKVEEESKEAKLMLLCYPDYKDGGVRAEKNALIERKVKEYVGLLRTGDGSYDISLAFHDKIINAIDYAYDGSGSPETAAWAHNILGVFEEKGGVCESYARTYQLLLNYVGVENILVTGVSRNEAHVWNLVKLDDGNWYWCDLTWDDTPDWEWGISHNYFLVNDTQSVSNADCGGVVDNGRNFLSTHTLDTPEGTATKFLYALPARSDVVYGENAFTLRDTFEKGNFTYVLVGYDTVGVAAIRSEGDVTIPETVIYGGVTYTVIALGSVDGNGAFGLVADILKSGVTKVSIPKTVSCIFDFALRCDTLTAITVDPENPLFASVDGVLYTKSLKSIISYPASRGGSSYTLLQETENIANGAFSGIKHLTTLNIGKNLKSDGLVYWGVYYDFERPVKNVIEGEFVDIARRLQGNSKIVIDPQNSVYSSDGTAVYSNNILKCVFDKSITTFDVSASVQKIEAGVFSSLENLTAITVAEGNEYYTALHGVLYNRDATKIVAVPPAIAVVTLNVNLKSIDAYTFFNCKSLETIYYVGTVYEWKKLEKEENWCEGAGHIRIVCSDGVLDKNGSLIEAV